MSLLLDRLINFLKWPVAILFLLSVPAFIKSFSYFNMFTIKNACFIGGVLLFFTYRAALDKETKKNLQTLAHELTHAFFAVITFHKVTSINVHDEGGSMSFEGKGNWLIIAGPYFFPLFLFVLMIILSVFSYYSPNSFLTKGYNPLLVSFVFGVLMGAHFDMIGAQIHDKQTDFDKLGIPFCLMFIIPANFWIAGSVMAFNSKGYGGFLKYCDLLIMLNQKYLNMVF